ncbi:MAG: hypothetical protein AB8E15_05175 [Bdellovibrionales bacterium]
MNLQDLKEQLIEQSQQLWEKIQESSLYTQLKEKFDQLPIKTQRMVMAGVGVLLAVSIISIPVGFFDDADTDIANFEDTKRTYVRLMNLGRDQQAAPRIQKGATSSSLVSRAKSIFEEKALTEEQIVKVESFQSKVSELADYIPSEAQAKGLLVELTKLTLPQVVDLSHRIQRLDRVSKISDLNIAQIPGEAGYYSLTMKLTNYFIEEAPEEEESGKSKRRRGSKKRR